MPAESKGKKGRKTEKKEGKEGKGGGAQRKDGGIPNTYRAVYIKDQRRGETHATRETAANY
jgi:hypothetical protein